MKKIIAISILLIMTAGITYSQVNPAYEVGTWQGFRTAAISFTFDDGTANQFTTAIPMFDEFGFKLTMYTVIDWSGANWTKLQAAANNGHEIGSHTISHPHLGALTVDQQTAEIKNSRDQINTRITGQKCLTIAYPYCETGNISLTKQYYIAGRICSGSSEPKTPSDFYNISSIICGTQGSIKTVQDFNNRANSTANSKGWVVYLLHGVDNDGGYSPVTKEVLRGALAYLDSNKTKFWVTSFVNAVLYIKERNNVSIRETSALDSVITFTVTDTLDNAIYNFPVTIRRQLPDGWISASLTQNGKVLPSEVVEVSSKKYVMFDVVPDEGEIQFTKSSITGIETEKTSLLSPQLMQNYPNPFNPKTKINYSIHEDAFVSLKIFDLYGKEVAVLVNKEMNPGSYEVEFDGNDVNASGQALSSGIYFYRLQAGKFVDTKKLILMK